MINYFKFKMSDLNQTVKYSLTIVLKMHAIQIIFPFSAKFSSHAWTKYQTSDHMIMDHNISNIGSLDWLDNIYINGMQMQVTRLTSITETVLQIL
jgi:hypothetical protein